MTPDLHPGIAERIAALSPAKRRLLALRAGPAVVSPEAARQVVAFVSAPAGTSPEALRRFAADQLPHYMVPTRFVALPAMPRTPNGKVDHALLRQLAREQAPKLPAETVPAAVLNEVEAQLCVIWSDLLGLEQIGAHDDFFALGGHSLLAVRMLARVKAELGYDVPVALIVESPTIARLGEHIRATAHPAPPLVRNSDHAPAQQFARSVITPIQPDGMLAPLYFLPLHIHGALHYRHLKEHLGTGRPLYGFAAFSVAAGALPAIETLASEYVEALLAFQPRGPYYLAGISIAGLLAFEMARQLQAGGVHDVMPILFDTWGPGYPRRLPTHHALLQAVRQFVSGGSIPRATRALDLFAKPLEQGYSALKMLRATSWAATNVPNDGSVQDGNSDPNLHLGQVDERLGVMTAAYLDTPYRYPGAITLFRAANQPWNAHSDPTLGWDTVVSGGILVEHVRGDHLGMLRRRYVGGLAAALTRRLALLDRNHPFTSGEGNSQ